jgi:hypothetical protein
MNGQELAEQVLALRPGIKVVFMSGYPGGIVSGHGIFRPGRILSAEAFSNG